MYNDGDASTLIERDRFHCRFTRTGPCRTSIVVLFWDTCSTLMIFFYAKRSMVL
jgi:hypothetical protein